jgi:hypothetical protein
MIHRLHFITGIVMLVLAATLAFMVSRRPAPQESASSGKSATAPHRAAPRAPKPAAFPAAPAVAGRSPTRDEAARPRAAAATPLLSGDLQVTVDPAHPRHAELAEQAGQVERHARERIATLTRALDLTPAQQRRIFPLLVRASDSYDPAMLTAPGSHAAATVTTGAAPPLDDGESGALIEGELDPAQQDQLVEHSLTDLMLWEEIIGNLVEQLEQVPAEPAPPNAVRETSTDSPPGPPEVPAPQPSSRGGRNLFESVLPAE